VEHLFASAGAPAAPLFDRIVLAAADESATTCAAPRGGRLSNLARLGRRITVYFDNEDIAMSLSRIANGNVRLGYAGPPTAADTSFFPRDIYDFVDCTGVDDYLSSRFEVPDRSHQYYRQSPTVRTDILTTLAGVAPRRLGYDATTNLFRLFPAPIFVAGTQSGPGNAA